MPIYCEMKTVTNGEFFPKCGTREIAKSVANTGIEAGDNATLVSSYSWSAVSNDVGLNAVSFHFSVTVPAYAPSIASAFNVLNGKDTITDFKLNVVGSSGGTGMNRNKITKSYIGETGTLVSVNLDEQDKADGTMTLSFEFEKMSFDNGITNTSGVIKTTDGGY